MYHTPLYRYRNRGPCTILLCTGIGIGDHVPYSSVQGYRNRGPCTILLCTGIGIGDDTGARGPLKGMSLYKMTKYRSHHVSCDRKCILSGSI